MQRRASIFLGAFILLTLCLRAAVGQINDVVLDTEPSRMGLNGYFRPGQWTALSLTLENKAVQPRRVICEWWMHDIDGDQVAYRRAVTLSPQSVQSIWIYGQLPLSLPTNVNQAVSQTGLRVIEVSPDAKIADETGRQLVNRGGVASDRRIAIGDRVVGITGITPGLMGLRPYSSTDLQPNLTQQQPTQFITGLEPANFPDRWQGLSLLQSLIWTPAGGEAALAPEAARQSVRQWVRRGGHLIIVLPNPGNTWFDSPMADMLPVEKSRVRTISDVGMFNLPGWLGSPVREGTDKFAVTWFELPEKPGANAGGAHATALLRDAQGRPWVVAGQYGLGRVTLIGIDLTDPRLVRMGLPGSLTFDPNPPGKTLWATVMGWRGPVFSQAYLDGQRKDGKIVHDFSYSTLDRYIGMMVSMPEAGTLVLLAAVPLFGVYWLLAGPVSYFVLRRKKMVRHTWLAFAVVVAAFTVICWAGAMTLRPGHQRVEHFTVIDGDAASGVVRGRSWWSLFVPRHGRVNVQLAGGEAQSGALMGFPGYDSNTELNVVFSQRYVMDCANPTQASLPYRASAKTGQLDFLIDSNNQAGYSKWARPRGQVTRVGNRPVGDLVHDLPAPLRDVLVIYCPGDGKEPSVWRREKWPAGEHMAFDKLMGQSLATPPIDPTSDDANQRAWAGHLGQLLRQSPAVPVMGNNQTELISDDRRVQMMEMLSLFGSLPPPDFRNTNTYPMPARYDPGIFEGLDRTAMLALPRLIIIGHLDQRETLARDWAAPIEVDGQPIDARGWTLVRWVLPVQ